VLSGGSRINNPTSTKQLVNDRSGLLVLGSDNSTHRYWFHELPVDRAAGVPGIPSTTSPVRVIVGPVRRP
jgi:hypothetical protein